jgi:hypothetical protein
MPLIMGRKERQKQTRSGANPGAESPDASRCRLFSIGHSNHEWRTFVGLLQAVGVTAIADVRSQPYSRWLPQYNRNELAQGLQTHDIAYAFLGNLLGGRPTQADLYAADGHVDYERVRATDAFRRGLDQLVEALDQFRAAMLCSEEDPLDCHRALMIGPALAEQRIAPMHLRGDGTIETTPAMENRLLALTRCRNPMLDGLFADMISAEERNQSLAEAYRVQARRKAFRVKPEDSLEVNEFDSETPDAER